MENCSSACTCKPNARLFVQFQRCFRGDNKATEDQCVVGAYISEIHVAIDTSNGSSYQIQITTWQSAFRTAVQMSRLYLECHNQNPNLIEEDQQRRSQWGSLRHLPLNVDAREIAKPGRVDAFVQELIVHSNATTTSASRADSQPNAFTAQKRMQSCSSALAHSPSAASPRSPRSPRSRTASQRRAAK
jgi:hypothetical protein